MLLNALIGLVVAGTPAAAVEEPLTGHETYCIATGYCTSRPGDSGRPSGPMFVAIGLIGAGLAGLRRERPRSG